MSRFVVSAGPVTALLSAALFGLSTPLAKLMIGNVDPWLLAAILYLGSGIGLSVFYAMSQWRFRSLSAGGAQTDTAAAAVVPMREAPLRLTDLPWLLAVIASGGIAAPVLLMLGLNITPASSAALLLNLESVFTMLLAWLVFHEGVDRRLMMGAAALVAGAVLLAMPAEGGAAIFRTSLTGFCLIAGACLCWAVDNNFTRKLSAADPVQIAAAKGLVAGSVNLVLALAQHARLPDLTTVVTIGVIGLFCYGISLVLFVQALRQLGAARTGAYFAIAPFIGASCAFLLLGEPLTVLFMAAAVLMAIGLYLHLTEAHEHEHHHAVLRHDHRHRHDSHHQHPHQAGDPAVDAKGMHRHPHRHEALTHRHRHFPDIHHQHTH
ncbi:MAG TPA: DMT family transporter [Terriglobia bacterium]|nr:DMT family transporter [Terriglobia bacterium]